MRLRNQLLQYQYCHTPAIKEHCYKKSITKRNCLAVNWITGTTKISKMLKSDDENSNTILLNFTYVRYARQNYTKKLKVNELISMFLLKGTNLKYLHQPCLYRLALVYYSFTANFQTSNALWIDVIIFQESLHHCQAETKS